MNYKAFAALCLVASVLVIPQSVDGRVRRADDTTTTEASSSNTTAAPCNQPGGLVGLLALLGRILTGVLKNIPLLGQLGLTNPNGVADLAGVLEIVRDLLINLLKALQLGNLNLTSENGSLSQVILQLQDVLNGLFNGDQTMTCPADDGAGGPLGQLIKGIGTIVTGSDATHDIGLTTLVNALLKLVGDLLEGLRLAGLLRRVLPGLGINL